MDRRRLQRVVLGLAAAGAAAVGGSLWYAMEHRGPPGAREVLSWLPEDTETVVHAGGPFSLEFESKNPESPLQLAHLALWPLLFVFSEHREVLEDLQGRTISRCVAGSGSFREPGFRGHLSFDGATIIVFEEALGSSGRAFMKGVEEVSVEAKEIEGHRAAVLPAQYVTSTDTLLVSHPARHVIVAATDEPCLRAVLKRMNWNLWPRRLPWHVEQWWRPAMRSASWAARRFSASGAADDVTSPLNPRATGWNAPDPQALGVIVAVGPDEPGKARVTYLSGSPVAVATVTGFWKRWGRNPDAQISVTGPGEVEIVTTMSEDVLAILGYLIPKA